jgi:subtilisin family serine protease
MALAARQRAMSARNRIPTIVQRLVVATVLGAAAARAAEPGRAPMVIRGTGPLRPVLAPGEEKLDTRLRALIAPPAAGPAPLVPVPPPGLRGSKAHVYVRVDAADAGSLGRLAQAGLRVDRVDAEHRLVRGWLRAKDLRRLATLGVVRSVSPVRPGFVRAGSVDTQGDAAANAPAARASCAGCDGSGITVGVISDGIDHVAQSISTGDLPPGTRVPAGAGCAAGSGDEGTAMLEIVHDLAPGATLLFSEGLSDKMQFIDSLTCLENAGARVIVDDIGFFDEPFFEDGPVAQAVRAVVQAGVSYHSAAGNEADIHYGGLFRAAPSSTYHNFASSGPADTFDDMQVPVDPAGCPVSGNPVAFLDCVLQWNDPFETPTDDYDLELYDVSTSPPTLVTASTNRQPGTPAFEEVAACNRGPGVAHAAIAIKKVSGADRQLSLFCFGAEGSMQYVVPAGSIVGHPAIREAVAVGAIDVHDTGLDAVESYSSQGPVVIYSPTVETRPKPDLAGFDGVATSVAGFSPFYGTSAAAPHAAAVAALLLSKNDCRTPAQIQQALLAGADDILAPGFDSISGAGRLDALGAIGEVAPKSCTTDADCDDGNACTTDACEGCACVHRAACDDGNPCTTDTCDAEAGCQHVPVADGTPCADGNLCNGTETCRSGTCTPGTPLSCDGTGRCAADTCDPSVGCTYPPLEGFPGLDCLCARGLETTSCAIPPRGVAVRFARACKLVRRASRLASHRRQRRLVGQAMAALGKAMKLTTKGVRRGLSPDCARSLMNLLEDTRGRAGSLEALL